MQITGSVGLDPIIEATWWSQTTVDGMAAEFAAGAWSSDELLASCIALKNDFYWQSHTLSHLARDNLGTSDCDTEDGGEFFFNCFPPTLLLCSSSVSVDINVILLPLRSGQRVTGRCESRALTTSPSNKTSMLAHNFLIKFRPSPYWRPLYHSVPQSAFTT